MITIDHLQKSYGKLAVLKGISLEFNTPGTITAILGPNGSGKTTLMKSILGMVLPDKGDILIGGRSIKGQWAYRQEIDYLPQIARFPENLRVRELIAFIHDLRQGQTREDELIRLFGLEEHLDKRLNNLSGGTKQKVNLVLAFMYDSPILILDEPTSGLDPIAMLHLKEFIHAERKRGKLILITTHIIHFVEEMADEIVFLLEGNIYFRGSQDELKSRFGETSLERAIAGILGAGKTEMNGNGSKTLHTPSTVHRPSSTLHASLILPAEASAKVGNFHP